MSCASGTDKAGFTALPFHKCSPGGICAETSKGAPKVEGHTVSQWSQGSIDCGVGSSRRRQQRQGSVLRTDLVLVAFDAGFGARNRDRGGSATQIRARTEDTRHEGRLCRLGPATTRSAPLAGLNMGSIKASKESNDAGDSALTCATCPRYFNRPCHDATTPPRERDSQTLPMHATPALRSDV